VVDVGGWVLWRIAPPAAGDPKPADRLEVTAARQLEHLARLDQPPHRHAAVVLHRRLHRLDRPHVHPELLRESPWHDTAMQSEEIARQLLELGSATLGESGAAPLAPRVRAIWSGAPLA